MSPEISELFNPNLIECVFKVNEFAFDAEKLKERMQQQLADNDIEVWTSSDCTGFNYDDSKNFNISILSHDIEQQVSSRYLFNCTYSSINRINHISKRLKIPLKHELTEMALIKMPEAFLDFSITVMCGPFFSIMPFPSKGLHTLSHVRYTPH